MFLIKPLKPGPKQAAKPVPEFDVRRELREIKGLLYVCVVILIALFAFFVGVLAKYVLK